MTFLSHSLTALAPTLAVVVLTATLMLPADWARAQDVGGMVERLERLERELRTLERQVYRGGDSAAPAGQGATVPGQPSASDRVFQQLPPDIAGRLQVRMSELEELVQQLTGRVEEVQYRTRRLGDRLDQLITDIDYRLSRLESGLAQPGAGPLAEGPVPSPGPVPLQGAPGAVGAEMGVAGPLGTPPPEADPRAPTPGEPRLPPTGQGTGILGYLPRPAPSADGAGTKPPAAAAAEDASPPPEADVAAARPVLPEGSPKEQYDFAFGLLRKGSYAEAEEALKAFLERHPEHRLAGNAQYWLGETHYVRGDLERAAVAFLDGYRNYPKSAKGPDNLLKLGLTMGRLDQTKEACAALQRLVTEYPQASDVIKRRAASEREQLGCR